MRLSSRRRSGVAVAVLLSFGMTSLAAQQPKPAPPAKKNPLLKLVEPWPTPEKMRERKLEAEASPLSRQTPLFLAHGRADPVVAYAWGESTARGLQQRGYAVEWRSYPMGHEVSAEEIGDLARWLSLRLQL